MRKFYVITRLNPGDLGHSGKSQQPEATIRIGNFIMERFYGDDAYGQAVEACQKLRQECNPKRSVPNAA